MVRGSYSTTYFYLFFFFKCGNNKHKEISDLTQFVPFDSQHIFLLLCLCLAHLRGSAIFCLSPPPPPPSLLHMGLTYDPHTSNAIAWPDLWSTNQLHLESQTGRGAMALSWRWRSASQQISARKSLTAPPAPAQDNSLPCHTPSLPWRNNLHSLGLQKHLGFDPPHHDRFRESYVLQYKKNREIFLKKCI